MSLIFPYPAVVGQTYQSGSSIVYIYDGLSWNASEADFINDVVITAGTSGSSGSSGTSGSSGSSGINGTSGSSGKMGLRGFSGSSGSSGTTGSTGTSGSSGIAGSSGVAGTSGTSGKAGTSGSSGASGTNGTSGTSGVDGASGLTQDLSYLATTGSNTFNGNQTISGSVLLSGSIIFDDGTTQTTAYVGGGTANTNQNSFYINESGSFINYSNFTASYQPYGAPPLNFQIGYQHPITTETGINVLAVGFPDGTIQTTAFNGGSFATTGSNTFIGDQILSGALYFNDDYNSTQAAMGMFPAVSGSGSPLYDNASKDFVILSATSDITLVTLLNNAPFDTLTDIAQVSLTRSGSLDVYANMNVSGSIIPAVGNGTFTSSFSLGSPTNAWKDLYISQGSIIFVNAVTQATSSFSIDTEAGTDNVKYTAGITASYYEGDGGRLYNLPSTTNWNKNEFTIRKTEQLTFSGDYILEDSYLVIEGNVPNSIGEWINVNPDGNDGTITRTSNNTYRIDGANDDTGSGQVYIKRFFNTPITMSIGYEWRNQDTGEDWPIYEVTQTEPTGAINNTTKLENNNNSYETGSWIINVPANNWLAIGVYSTDSCCGSGSLNITLPYLFNEDSVQYAPNKYFKKEGSIFIGGNLLVKDSIIENNGKISVGGEVILIGNSEITGTGIII